MAGGDDMDVGGAPLPRTPLPFSVAVRTQEERVVVAPSGELDLATVARVQAALAGAEAPTVVLDLRDVSFLDTSGLRLVLEQEREAERAGRRFALVAGPPTVQRLFEIAGLTERLTFLRAADVPGGDAPPH